MNCVRPERSRLLLRSDVPNVRVIEFDRSSQPVSFYTENYSVSIMVEAHATISFRGQKVAARSGDLGLLDPGGVFRVIDVTSPATVYTVLLAPALMDPWLTEVGPSARDVFAAASTVGCPELFASLRSVAADFQAASRLELESRIAAVVPALVARASGGRTTQNSVGSERAAVRRVREVLHDRFAEPIALGDLADAAGLSPFQLSRAFVREVGLSPHAYQTHLRLSHARECLLRGGSAAQVAVASGFADQSHMTRHFRRTVGLTPRAFASDRIAANGRARR